MERVHVKPAEGRRVRDEAGNLLALEGKKVVLNSYWRRRRDDKDIVVAEETVSSKVPSDNRVKHPRPRQTI